MFGQMEKLHSNHSDLVHVTCFEGACTDCLALCRLSMNANYSDRITVQFYDESEDRPKPIRESDVYYRAAFDVFTNDVKVSSYFAIVSFGIMLMTLSISLHTKRRAFAPNHTTLIPKGSSCTSVLNASKSTTPVAFASCSM